MNDKHASPVAIVTGGSRGFGLETARALADRGWALVIDARGSVALQAAAAELAERTRVTAVPGDVVDPGHRRELLVAAEALGGPDLLVNNASALGPSPLPPLGEYPLGELADVFSVDVLAPLGLVQLVLPELRERRGTIVNVTSDAAVEGYPGWGGYGAAKAALEQLSRVLAAEEPAVRVIWFDPGDMNTAMQQEAYPGEDVSDRPPPASSVPSLLRLVEGSQPSGRYVVEAPASR